jgi:5-methylcytosine-specific restriction enzyme A
MFEVGQVYDRRREIHGPYGGQWQSGISTPADQSFIFLFTGEAGEHYGYRDGWEENGVFLYTGEGQVGDQQFTHGNRATRDDVKDGKDLHLFESLGKGQGYRYLGMFVCPTWEHRRGLDLNGDERQVIVFHLVQPGEEEEQETTLSFGASVPFDRLRQQAVEASSQAQPSRPREARSLYYKRSATVRKYVLARAGEVCESCGNPAPFLRKDGSPYLEPHHTRRVSDGGARSSSVGRSYLSKLPPGDSLWGGRRGEEPTSSTTSRRTGGWVA